MVYDLGGGTFDVSIIEMGDGIQQVLATAGNNHLGGDDFDERIINYLADNFKAENGIDLRSDRMALQRLKEAAEKAKIELSGMTTANINLPFITADATGPKHMDVTLTRAKFNELTADLVESTMGPVRQALSDAGLQPSQIDKVLLVGGSTRIPAVVDAVKNFMGKDPFRASTPMSAWPSVRRSRAAFWPVRSRICCCWMSPPLSLGLETLGGVCTRIIDRNTTIPVKKSQIFSTATDNQTSVDIHVLQGEREMAADNKTLGRFQLDGIATLDRVFLRSR